MQPSIAASERPLHPPPPPPSLSLQVDPHDFNVEMRRVTEVAQSFTRSDMNDQQIVRLMLESPVALAPDKHYMLSALIKVLLLPVGEGGVDEESGAVRGWEWQGLLWLL